MFGSKTSKEKTLRLETSCHNLKHKHGATTQLLREMEGFVTRIRSPDLTAMLIFNLSASFCFALGALLFSDMVLPYLRVWILLFILGGCVNGFGYLFWILALRATDTAKISSAVYLTPFAALLYLFLFRRNPISLIQLISLSLIVAGPLVQKISL